jgi:HNH endonuclease
LHLDVDAAYGQHVGSLTDAWMTDTVPAKRRPPVPKQIEREVLFRNRSVCCICQKPGVQIHHIDGDPSNNAMANLCILCIEHHAEASSKSTMLRHLSSSLLRKYKSAWESKVALTYGVESSIKRGAAERPSRLERREVAMEIKRVIYHLNSEKSAK